MQERRFVESFNDAVEGFIYVMKSQRNMRVHFLAAIFVLLLAIYLNFNSLEMIALILTITFVLAAEMVNTVVELVVDMVKSEFHPIARLVKDISAGAVLLTAVNAAIVGYLLFSRRISFRIEDQVLRVRQSAWHLTFIAFILVLGFVILGKAVFHKGTPLRGGMPSGHAAVAFSVWTIIAFLSSNSIIITLTFLLAFLIARHRIRDSIHTIWEVLAGAVLGVLLTAFIFQMFK